MALRYELIKNNIPINVITVCPGPVKTEFADVAKANPKMKGLSVEKCVKIILEGIEKNKALIIPGFKMKILRFLIRFSPTWLLLKVSHQIQNKK
jgi:short-subunit dehydrogenase